MVADKQKVIRLLKTARGQIDGLLKMVEEDRYCVDISNQIAATQAILKSANREILHAHIQGCVREAFESGDQRQKDAKIEEILGIIDRLNQ
ncbi:MAG TPA: metal-sensing transcriptional repressor [Flexilinea sp.]|nr:metal-sensing transcriptional repressor [Flexilinea sp.]HNY93972.1 metal-sensing transcriptional repressor [Flexilinea sp.]HOG22869.1 metal-sensing transcriptional repressor [Flexilinea sp.]HOG61149.1 metal-sensing transcriptional repressor [Flexilinea sp.]HOR56854.1 metal-sensing transcriptional repressor [Flexilinea sp.]